MNKPFATWMAVLTAAWVFSLHHAFGLKEMPQLSLWDMSPVEAVRIITGIQRTPGFWDTFAWWSGPWVMGPEVPYYRPLISQWWWWQYQIHGADSYWPYLAKSWALHMAVTVLAFTLLRRLVPETLAGLAVLLWLLHAAWPLGLPVPAYCLITWINDPDIIVCALGLGALHLLLNYWRGGSPLHAAGALLLFGVAIGFKELAYVIPPLALLMWWYARPQARWPALWPVAALGVLALLAFCWRWYALGGPGHQQGPNGSWLQRAVVSLLGGRAAATVNGGEVVPLALACAVFALGLAARKRLRPAGAAGAVCAVLVWMNDSRAEFPWDAALKLMNLFPLSHAVIYQDALLSLAVLWLWWDFLKTRDRIRLFAVGWFVICYLPGFKDAVLQHALYWPALGWALFMAVPLRQAAAALRQRGQELFPAAAPRQ